MLNESKVLLGHVVDCGYSCTQAVFYPTLSVAKDGLYDVGVINGTDGLEESDTYYSRRGRRQSVSVTV